MAHLRPDVSATDQIQGDVNAPVTLVEYGDYECPHCGAAYPMIKQVQKKMGKKLRFVFRNFPLSEAHPHALNAAVAAEAAGRQGKFWEMHDIIYENQSQLELDDLLRYAAKIGIDTEKFDSDFEDEKLLSKVKSDFNSGVRSGVNGTPSFYITGEKYEGEYEGEAIVHALNKVLQRN